MPNHFNIVVVSQDPAVASKIQRVNSHLCVSHVTDLKALEQEASSRCPDWIVVETKTEGLDKLAVLAQSLDLSNTCVLAGPLPVIEATMRFGQVLGNGSTNVQVEQNQDFTLDNYVKAKVGDFVRAMKASSSRSLYSTLIRAVERPLIELALRETNANQIQAARLLGMNRNTLRKKITEFKIPVKNRTQVGLQKKPKGRKRQAEISPIVHQTFSNKSIAS